VVGNFNELVAHLNREDYHNYEEFKQDLEKMRAAFMQIKCSNRVMQEQFFEKKS